MSPRWWRSSFNVDPYDAVGSFAVLLASFTGLLSLVRAFRPYATEEIESNQTLLILRGETVTLLSIAATVATDAVAILRNPSTAISSSAGLTLSALVIGLALLTTLAGWWIYHSTKNVLLASDNRSWRRAIIICLASVVILAVYPLSWDKGMIGAISTALLGMLILFIPLWALAIAMFPKVDIRFEDSMDDFVAIYHWFKSDASLSVELFNLAEKFMNFAWVSVLLGWLNPRKHNWNFIILIAVATGIALASAEAIGEGASPDLGKFVLVMSVFIGIGGAGVIFGYLLLADYLGIFRKN